MGNKIISVLEQLKQNGQLNDYLIDDDERKWTKLVYDILVNKFDYPFGRETMQQANQIYNDSVVAWKGQGKMTDLMGRAGFGEGKESNKRLIRLTESDLHRIVKESVQKILKEMGDDNYPRLSVEKSRPGDVPPGDQDIHYPGDVNPDVLDSLQRGDFGNK